MIGTLTWAPTDTAQYLSATEPGQLHISLGASRAWVPQALVAAAWTYGQVSDLAPETWGFKDLEGWRRHWAILFARCRPLDPEKVKNVGRNDDCPYGSGFKFKHCHLEVLRS